MRRAPWVLGATATGFAAVLTFHTHSAPFTIGSLGTSSQVTSNAPVAAGPPAGKKTGSATTAPTTTPSSPTTTRPRSTSTSVPSTTAPSTTTPPSTTAPSTTTPPTTTAPTTTTTTPRATRSATGPAVNYNYGVLSVTVTASGSKITDVQIASLDDGGNFRSQSIDQQSIPLLEQQALQAQSANIQGVSGATYTSAGFAQSLQGALSQLGL